MRRLIAITLALLCGTALGVRPATWRHATEADFADGQFDSTTVNSRGEISLSRRIKVLMAAGAAPPVVSAVVAGRDAIYAASGTTSDIYRIADGKAVKFASLPGAIITSMIPPAAGIAAADGAVLLAAVGGGDKTCGIYAVDAEGKATALWSDKSVKYVWAMLPGSRGVLYAATGAGAKVIEIIDGKARVIYEAGELAKNILCLARRADGRLYAGTDEKGLVVEIDPLRKSSRIIFDAAEKEIASIIPAPGGGLFVATSDAAKASADGKVAPAGKKSGKAAAAKKPKVIKGAKPTSAPATTKPSSSPPKRRAGPTSAAVATKPPSVRRHRPSRRDATPAGQGNAVYLIEPAGLVRTIFRKPLTILAMLLQGDRLLLATGNGGAVYSMTLDGDVVSRLADTDARQVTALSMSPAGDLILATANKGSVVAMGRWPAGSGTFTSKALDAKQITLWGTARCRAVTPAGTKVTIATRSGNLEKPDDATWSDWSGEQPLDDEFTKIASPAARFLQYRLTLTAGGEVGAKSSPTVQDLVLIYQVGNLAPVISAVKVSASAKSSPRGGGGQGPKIFRRLAIVADDANGDSLLFRVEFRAAGSQKWIRIAKKLTKPAFVWDTRTVGDAAYELRVTASDRAANPPASALEAARIAEPVVVDNTRPTVEKLAVRVAGGKVAVAGEALDATSRIVDIRYSIDSAEDWTSVLPADGICDSQREKFTFEIDDLKAGAHHMAIKVTDLYGNVAYVSTTVTILQPR